MKYRRNVLDGLVGEDSLNLLADYEPAASVAGGRFKFTVMRPNNVGQGPAIPACYSGRSQARFPGVICIDLRQLDFLPVCLNIYYSYALDMPFAIWPVERVHQLRRGSRRFSKSARNEFPAIDLLHRICLAFIQRLSNFGYRRLDHGSVVGAEYRHGERAATQLP
jgi:hypothetical protein